MKCWCYPRLSLPMANIRTCFHHECGFINFKKINYLPIGKDGIFLLDQVVIATSIILAVAIYGNLSLAEISRPSLLA